MPQTSDHLFSLEQNPAVALLSAGWEMRGEARILSAAPEGSRQAEESKWCALVRVDASQMHIRREAGWGNLETIDQKSG